MTTATFTGNVEQSQVSIRYQIGLVTVHPRIIPVLTNGDGDVGGTVENTLNFYKDTSASTIEASVLHLCRWNCNIIGTDSSIDLQEFAVEFSGDCYSLLYKRSFWPLNFRSLMDFSR